MIIEEYIENLGSVRRYSERTKGTYRRSLEHFVEYVGTQEVTQKLNHQVIRGYEVWLLEEKGMSAKSVNLHISVLSSLCKYLIKRKLIASNPISIVTRPKGEKKLPEFIKQDSISEYFERTAGNVGPESIYISPDKKITQDLYEKRLRRAIISVFYNTGIRRAELIGLRRNSIDYGRKVARVLGKGDKMREIPLIPSLLDELDLLEQAVEVQVGIERRAASPLFVTFTGKQLYPSYVDSAVKKELGGIVSITGRKSPHVLRHTIATQLLNSGADLNSIKELLGHSSLAATQVYTHNSIAKLKATYAAAHPRAKKEK